MQLASTDQCDIVQGWKDTDLMPGTELLPEHYWFIQTSAPVPSSCRGSGEDVGGADRGHAGGFSGEPGAVAEWMGALKVLLHVESDCHNRPVLFRFA
jgi:hypothetical protein